MNQENEILKSLLYQKRIIRDIWKLLETEEEKEEKKDQTKRKKIK